MIPTGINSFSTFDPCYLEQRAVAVQYQGTNDLVKGAKEFPYVSDREGNRWILMQTEEDCANSTQKGPSKTFLLASDSADITQVTEMSNIKTVFTK